MAQTVLSDFSSVLQDTFLHKITPQFKHSHPLLNAIPIMKASGKTVNRTVEFYNGTASVATSETQTHTSSDASQNDFTVASAGFSKYTSVVSLSGKAISSVEASQNPQSLLGSANRVTTKEFMNAIKNLEKGIATDLFSGDETASPTELAGVERAVDSTGTFFGINPATFSDWAAVEDTMPLSTLNSQIVREELLTPIFDACHMMPHILVTKQNVVDILRREYAGSMNYAEKIYVPRGAGYDGSEPYYVSLSSPVPTVEGIPIMVDPNCTANTMYAINLNHFGLEYLTPGECELWQKSAAIEYFALDAGLDVSLMRGKFMPLVWNPPVAPGFFNVPIGITQLGNVNDGRTWLLHCFIQTVWDSRNCHGKLTFT